MAGSPHRTEPRCPEQNGFRHRLPRCSSEALHRHAHVRQQVRDSPRPLHPRRYALSHPYRQCATSSPSSLRFPYFFPLSSTEK